MTNMRKRQATCSVNENDVFTNDPYNLTFLQAQLEFKPKHTVRQFTVTTDSYISMCSGLYKAICMNGYGRTISESVFQYYAVSSLWERLRRVGYKNKPESPDQIVVRRLTNAVPIPLNLYLKGIGSYNGPDFCYRQFRMPIVPTKEKFGPVTGTFGPINANNHYFYEAYPAPGIAVLRILADLKYTANPCEDNLIWDLPLDLRPIENCHGTIPKPTRNLLGWAPAQRLTKLQVEFLQKLGVTADNFPTTCKLYCRNKSILNSIFHTFERDCECAPFPLDEWRGSFVQGISLQRSSDDSQFDRTSMYCDGRMSASSYHKFSDKLATGAMISGYRMSKQPMYDKHCWSCYDFNDYKDVPESWIETRNRIYEWGSVGTLNEPIFTTISADKKVEQNLHIRKAQSVSSDEWDIHE